MRVSEQTVSSVLQSAWNQGVLDPVEDTAALFVDWDVLEHRLAVLKNAWPGFHHAVAIKSQPHPAVLKHLVSAGFGLEAASSEEVKKGRAAGCPSDRLVFDSPVKTSRELLWVHQNAPGMLVNANALEELPRHPSQPSYRLGLRINPEIHTGSPQLFHVSSNASKFGVALSNRSALLEALNEYPITGLHLHSGSQITDLPAQIRSIRAVFELAMAANEARRAESKPLLNWIDIGGGLPAAPWEGMETYAAAFYNEFSAEELRLFDWHTEFGQWVHAQTGWTVSRLEYVLPRTDAPDVAYLHVGADLFLRDAYTAPRPFPRVALDLQGKCLPHQPQKTYDLAGPLCFAGDYLARSVELPVLTEGGWLALLETGANAYGLWSRHCSRTIPALVGYRAGGTVERLSDRISIDF